MSTPATYPQILQRIEAAGHALRLAARIAENPRMEPPTLAQLTSSLAQHLQCDRLVAAALCEQVGIQEPLAIHLTEARIVRFLRTCRQHPTVMPIPPSQRVEREVVIEPAPAKTSKPKKRLAMTAPATPGPARESQRERTERLARERAERYRAAQQAAAARPTTKPAPVLAPAVSKEHARLNQARQLLKTAARQHVSPLTRDRRREVLLRDLANALALPPSQIKVLLSSAGVSVSDRQLTPERIEKFISTVRIHPVFAQRLAAAQTARPVPATVTAPIPTVRPAAALAACRRLMSGNVTGEPARLTADLYLAVAELCAYGATPEERAAGPIAAERFGVHTDAATAATIHARAARQFARATAGEYLDHLSRLARRPRGVFYDGHLDRLTLWETEEGVMTLYTCMVAELRSRAAAAVGEGDLGLPRMAKRVVTDLTMSSSATDPALVLAAAAEQLGHQSELSRRRAETRSAHPEEPERTPQVLSLTAGARPGPAQAVGRSSATWVVPVAGTHEELEVNRMDVSYTRRVAGPRSRRGTMVRGHMRRPAGSGPYAQPTIPVRPHPRRGT